MKGEKLEKIITHKIRPLVEDAMQKFLGVTVSEIEQDIEQRIKKSPLLEFEVDTRVPFKKAKKNFKRQYIVRLLQLNFGNVAEVARLAGIDRRSIHRLIEQLNINPDQFRRVLLRGEYVKRQAMRSIIEDALENYKSALHPARYESLYEQAPELSKDIVKELPEEPVPLKVAEHEWERKYLKKALEENNNNISKTARKIGLRFETLHRKLKGFVLK